MTTRITRAALAGLGAVFVLVSTGTPAHAQLHGLLGRYYEYDGGYLEDLTFSDPGYSFGFARNDFDITFGYEEEYYTENNGNGRGFDWEPFGPGAGAFGVHWSGFITIPRGKPLHLGTEADDGSYLFVNDELFIDNGGQHYPTFAWSKNVLTEGTYEIDLYLFANDLVPPEDKSGIDLWWSPMPKIIDDSAWVPGEALTPVPEPATLALLGLGLVGSALSRRRRK